MKIQIEDVQRIIDKSGKAFMDSLEGKPAIDIKSLEPQEMKVLEKFNSYVAKPEVYAKYEAGAKDKEIINDFLS